MVYLLWEQANHERDNPVPHTTRRPQLIGVYDNPDTPEKNAQDFNERRSYSTRWVVPQTVRS